MTKTLVLILLMLPAAAFSQTLVTNQEVSTNTVMTLSSTQTVTGAKVFTSSISANNFLPVAQTPYSGQTATPNCAYSVFFTTATGGTLTINAPSCIAVQGQKLLLRIKDDGTARALTWDAIYRAGDIALPTTTTQSKAMYLGFVYSDLAAKWDLLGYVDNF